MFNANALLFSFFFSYVYVFILFSIQPKIVPHGFRPYFPKTMVSDNQGNGNFSRRKETLSMSFVTEDSNFFQLLGYIFSAFKRHDINHVILRCSPVSKKLAYLSTVVPN